MMKDTKQKIIFTAIKIFASKGLHGTRMEEIAKHAKVNKAMVYYYFASKDKLFREAVLQILMKIFEGILVELAEYEHQNTNEIMKVEHLVRKHFRVFSENPDYCKLLLEAVATESDVFQDAMDSIKKNTGLFLPDLFNRFFSEGVKKNVFRKINPQQVLISVMGMNLIYFIERPIAKIWFQKQKSNESKFIKEREESIIDLLLYGIVKR
ncbi:MAG: TetR/AcrR family transcriptional regulator [Elusimicrobiota bacterium]